MRKGKSANRCISVKEVGLGILLGVVCLFSACGKEKAVFIAGEQPLEAAMDLPDGQLSGMAGTVSEEGTAKEDSGLSGSLGEPDGITDAQREQLSEAEELMVYVCGQVECPGVYTLKSGSRLTDAIELAGGMTENAAKDVLNLAQPVTDAQMIRVPSKEEIEELGIDALRQSAVSTEEGAKAPDARGETQGKISLNRATREELLTLSGIGESKADAILQYRKEQGAFQSIEEIMNIPGIKEGVFLKIKDQITI